VRATLLVIVALVAIVVAGCGGSSGDRTLSAGNGQTVTVPSNVHGAFGEIEVVLEQLPYQRWYTHCLIHRVKTGLSPSQAERLTELSGSEGEEKAGQLIAKAVPACEKATGRPTVDPNASSQELDLLRANYVPSMTQIAEANGLDEEQVACVERNAEELPDKQVVAMANGSHKIREGILLSVFEPCAKVK
jgi:hypothetical protein